MIRTGSPGRNNFFLFCEIFLLAGFFFWKSSVAGLQNCRFYREKEVVIFRIFLHRSRM